MLDIIGNKNKFLAVSMILVLLSVIFILVFGLRQGIDLKGGTRWQIETAPATGTTINEIQIKEALQAVDSELVYEVKQGNKNQFFIRLPNINEEQHQLLLEGLRSVSTEVKELSFSSIGPSIGDELKRQALTAVVLVMLGISLFVAYSFRKASRRISSWKYGIVTLVTLLHDVLIPTGMLAVLGRFSGIEIDTNFIVALLVVMGFSVHDTIVVFDRIRENVTKSGHHTENLRNLFNNSVKETFSRSLNTSLTLIIVLVALMAVGPDSLYYFVFTILLGTVVGTYSSIFVASPLLYIWGKDR